MAHGFELAFASREHRPVVAVIGDSTFAHSGLSSLISTVYNKGAGTVCILDNRTTAMTGRQGNPFNGETLQHRPSRELDMEGVLKALGIEGRATLVIGNEDINTYKSFRNIPTVTIVPVCMINTYDFLDNKTLVLTESTLARIEEVLA